MAPGKVTPSVIVARTKDPGDSGGHAGGGAAAEAGRQAATAAEQGGEAVRMGRGEPAAATAMAVVPTGAVLRFFEDRVAQTDRGSH